MSIAQSFIKDDVGVMLRYLLSREMEYPKHRQRSAILRWFYQGISLYWFLNRPLLALCWLFAGSWLALCWQSKFITLTKNIMLIYA